MSQVRLASTTLVVAYTPSSADKIIKAEIDPEKHTGSNFVPGSQVFFRLHANCNFEFHLSDNSNVAQDGTGVSTITDEGIQFVQTKESTIQYPYKDNWAASWWGTRPFSVPGAPAVNSTRIKIGTNQNEQTLVAVGKCSYRSDFKRYKLTPASSAEGYTVVILILETP